jgi:hypothetical protein
LLHQRRRGVHTLDADAPGRQRERDPAGPDRQFQHLPAPGQGRKKVHGRFWVHLCVMLVINSRPAIAIERGIIKSGHARH